MMSPESSTYTSDIPSHLQDFVGQSFGRLVVINYQGKSTYDDHLWLCRCICGNTRAVSMQSLKRGYSSSCGCLKKELISKRSKKHSMTKTKIYKCWQNMKNRCLDPSNIGYKDYGGRGITICDRWLLSFENFYADMGLPPNADYSIERVDNDGPYTQDNCVWAPRLRQNRNSRHNRLVTINGITKCISEWAEETGIPANVVYARLHRGGWTEEEAILTPLLLHWTARRGSAPHF